MTGYVTTQEAAKLLNVTDSRVRQMILAGDIKAEKAGSAVSLIRISEIARVRRKRAARRAKAVRAAA